MSLFPDFDSAGEKAKLDFLIRKENIHVSKPFSCQAIFCLQYRKDNTLGNLNGSGGAVRLL